MEILSTEEYHEDYGDCLFFHFPTFSEPPELYCGSPLDSGFDEKHWRFFTVDMDWNSIMDQAKRMDNNPVERDRAKSCEYPGGCDCDDCSRWPNAEKKPPGRSL